MGDSCHLEVGWWRQGDKGGWHQCVPTMQWEVNDMPLTVCQIRGIAASTTGSHLEDLLGANGI
jgi:hypothetical protein